MIIVKSMYCARSRNTIAVESRNADQFGVEERKIKRERESRDWGGFVIAVEERERRSRGPRSGMEALRTWAVKEANAAAVQG